MPPKATTKKAGAVAKPPKKQQHHQRKSKADDEEELLLAAAEAAAATTAAPPQKTKHKVKEPALPAVNAPATADAKPVDGELLDLFDVCTDALRQSATATAEQQESPFLWLRRSYASSLLGLHGEAFSDFERLVLILGGRIDLPDMQPEPAMALVRCFAAVGNFTRVDQLLPALTQLAGLSPVQQKSLLVYVESRKRDALRNDAGAPLLGIPVLLRDRSAVRCADNALSRINTHLASLRTSSSSSSASSSIEVRRSAYGGLGMFAVRDVEAGETILIESPSFVGSDPLTSCDRCGLAVDMSPTTCPKCKVARFCSQACLGAATAQYHAALCGIPTRGLESLVAASAVPSQKFNPLLIRKIFAAEIQRHGGGFLPCRPAESVPLSDACRKFDAARSEDDGKLTGDVWMALPLQRGLEEILKALPPAALADPRIDFTAVSQLQQVLISNGFGGRDGSSINLLRAANYFNHSCAPSAKWSQQPQGSADFVFTAARRIRRDQEVFISYGAMSGALRQQYGLPAQCCVSCSPPP